MKVVPLCPEGRAAKCFMVALGLTQGDVAKKLGVDQSTLSLLLTGKLERAQATEVYRMELWRKLWLLLSRETLVR